MGCGTFIAAGLALAIPASLAATSVAGAYVCLVLLAVVAAASVGKRPAYLVRVGAATAVYAVVIGVVAAVA